MKFTITNTQVYGLDRALKASGNPMRTFIETSEINEKDVSRSIKLANTPTGHGHDNFLKGVLVQFDITAPLYWWKQAQRYHWFDFVSSQSTMHCLLKFDIKSQCVDSTNSEIVALVEKLKQQYLSLPEDDKNKKAKWRELVASLPSGFCLGATMTTNYQQLKTMYQQRSYHRLSEWHDFCGWCDSLAQFTELCKTKR